MFFRYRPETPFTETLRFLTDVLPKKNGTEQRIALRAAPRQEFEYVVILDEVLLRNIFENEMFDAQDSIFQIPIWTDVAYLDTAASSGGSSLSFDTTVSDFRTGGSAVVYRDEDAYQVLTNLVVTDGGITFDEALSEDWPVGAEVFPVRDAIVASPIRSQRWPVACVRYTIRFLVTEGPVDLSVGAVLGFSTIGFGADSAKIVLSESNAIEETLAESSDRAVQVLDNNTGKLSGFSFWDRSRRGTIKTFITNTRAGLWDVRVLLHYLKGPQKSFLLPTFGKDAIPTTGIVSTGTTIRVVDAGFTAHNALGRNPRKYIRVVKNDGTYNDAIVTNITEEVGEVEELTVTPAWSRTVALDDIDKVMVIEKVRIDGDDITITHLNLLGDASVVIPAKAVLE